MIDFIDFGCGAGGSIEYAKAKFGGEKHLGIEKNENLVNIASENGYNVVIGDVLSMDIPKCRYITMLHFLEHLDNLFLIRDVIEKASYSAQDFIFIKVPYFDSDLYLAKNGLKLTWSDWTGHPTRLTTFQLKHILHSLKLDGHFGKTQPINSSDSDEILPFNAPKDTLYYKDLNGWSKKIIPLDDVYREMYCFIKLRNIDYFDELIKI